MAAKLCPTIVDGQECRLEMTRDVPGEFIGLRAFICPLGHRSFETITRADNPRPYLIFAFRRAITGDTWHFARDCSHWPITNFVESEILSGPACNECIVKSTILD